MKRLYFIRHGQSVMNVQGLFAGSTDTPLTDYGRKQAMTAGKHAKDLAIDYIVCSPLSRAHETAQIIAHEIGYPAKKLHVNKLFVERNYGSMEGRKWEAGMNLEDVVDAETKDEILIRARKALDFLESLDAKNILVVSHGSFGRALRHHIKEDFPFTKYERIENAQIIELL